MTHDDMERAIGFLLEHQARFDERLTRLEGVVEKMQVGLETVQGSLMGTIGLVHNLAQRVDALTVHMDTLTQRVDTLAIRVDEIGAKLDAFIVVTEKYITRNGGKPS